MRHVSSYGTGFHIHLLNRENKYPSGNRISNRHAAQYLTVTVTFLGLILHGGIYFYYLSLVTRQSGYFSPSLNLLYLEDQTRECSVLPCCFWDIT